MLPPQSSQTIIRYAGDTFGWGFALGSIPRKYHLWSVSSNRARMAMWELTTIGAGVFLTLFILLVVISCSEKEVRIAKQQFLLPVATLMMVIATTVGLCTS